MGVTDDPERMEKGNPALESLESASKKTLALNLEASRRLVIYCADPRFRAAFQEFVSTDLGISQHTLLSLAGGVGPFVLFAPDSLQAGQMIDQLRLFLTGKEIKQVIGINHSGCKWYSRLMPDCDSREIIDRQMADLRRFAGVVRSESVDVSIQVYLAALEDDKVCFKRVPIE